MSPYWQDRLHGATDHGVISQECTNGGFYKQQLTLSSYAKKTIIRRSEARKDKFWLLIQTEADWDVPASSSTSPKKHEQWTAQTHKAR